MSSRKHIAEAKPSFSAVLKQSDVPYLKFIGSCMDFFGVRTIVSFLLGLVAIYAYASIFGPPPYFPTTSPPRPETIRLNGVVHTLENKPLDEFYIAVVNDFVPVTSPKGAFQLQTPNRARYDLIVWEPKGGILRLYGNLVAVQKDDQYNLEDPLGNFPTNLGYVEGSARDLNNNPIKGFVEIEGKKAKIDDAGRFTLMKIPIGKTKIRVLPGGDPQQAWEEDLQVNVSGSTEHNVTAPR